MENFFYDDKFCEDPSDLAELLDIDEDNVNELPDDWKVRVELTKLEPIFNIDADDLCQMLCDCNEERLPEDFEETKTLNALKESIDFDKLRSLLPKLYYANAKFEFITKSDLINYL